MLASFVILAATYIVPPDVEMIQKSDAIVIATAVSSYEDDRNTHHTLRVEETLKGDTLPGETLVLTEMGGRRRMIAGAPRYEPGQRYLVFTSGEATFGMALGRFRIDGDRAVRNDVTGFDANLEPYTERARDVARFTRFVRDTVAGRWSSPNYFVATPQSLRAATDAPVTYTRTSYLLQDAGFGYRWPDPAVTFVRNGTQPDGGDGAVSFAKALAQWNATDSSIEYTDGGADATANGGLATADGKNAVLFNDPNGEIQDGSGIAGIGGAFPGDSMLELDGETFYSIEEGDVVIANHAFSQNCLDTIVTHELGHTLGIRHANEPPPGSQCNVTAQCDSHAVMNATVICAYAGVLQNWDGDAAAVVYGNGTQCRAPEITEQPGSTTVLPGSPVSLSVEVTGTQPLHYEWFADDEPIGFDEPRLVLNTGLIRSVLFYVNVSNDCGSETSNKALITVLARKRRPTHH